MNILYPEKSKRKRAIIEDNLEIVMEYKENNIVA